MHEVNNFKTNLVQKYRSYNQDPRSTYASYFRIGAHLLTAVTVLAELPARVRLKISFKCVYFEFLLSALKIKFIY